MKTIPFESNRFKYRFSANSRHFCLHRGYWPCPTHSLNTNFLINLQG